MKPQIPISQIQLSGLLDEEQRKFYLFVTQGNVFCRSCPEPQGMKVEELLLDTMNDIIVRGTCNTCQGPVARFIEFGEDKAFSKRANQFRKSLQKKG